MKIAFTLLHYNNIEVTKEAVSCLKKLNNSNYIEIVIVDNCSPNKSGEMLREIYCREKNIHVIINKENSGFAKGNNIAYLHAKKMGCDTIVVMNSDVFIRDVDFCEKLKEIVEKERCEIVAPKILTPWRNQNPFRTERLKTRKVLAMLLYNIFLNIVYRIPVINLWLARALDKKKKRESNKNISENLNIWAPHGSCVIYTHNWVSKEDIAFLPVTFMYFEEDILAEYIFQKNYVILYKDTLVVHHMEDASVDSTTSSSFNKRKFISGCMVNSIFQLLKMRSR